MRADVTHRSTKFDGTDGRRKKSGEVGFFLYYYL